MFLPLREEVQGQHVVFAPEPAGESVGPRIERIIRLAIHEDEAAGVGQGVRHQTQKRDRLAGARRARHRDMLPRILVADPQFFAGVLLPAEIDDPGSHAGR